MRIVNLINRKISHNTTVYLDSCFKVGSEENLPRRLRLDQNRVQAA